ncbi:MAG: glycoside hydrolase family 57 protein, partial [Armatimonadota bacterium]
MTNRVHVALVWHMHQPWYVWPNSRYAALPAARLHACAAYHDMPWLLRQFDDTRVTFNLVPSLVRQLERYVAGETTDRALELSERPAADLTPDDQRYLLTHLCGGHPAGSMAVSPRYGELLHKRGPDRKPPTIDDACRVYETADYLDLQVLFNLAWCGFALANESEVVRELRRKDRGFTEAEKAALLAEMRAAVQRVLRLYAEVARQGRAELICSPFYHPILPLLCNMDDAQRGVPASQLPQARWHEPEEARRQLQHGLEHHERVFGSRPRGLWPPEGGVSDAALGLIADEKLSWAASDEEVLAASLDLEQRCPPESLYQPWLVADGRLSLVFRDHRLSDLIGFVYRDWAAADAADDFVCRLLRIADQCADSQRPPLVSVILDGENPWGWYPDAGEAFLRELYRRIEQADELQTTTISEYLEQFPATERLASVFPGSWIEHSFRTRIGGMEHLRAWDLLTDALEATK